MILPSWPAWMPTVRSGPLRPGIERTDSYWPVIKDQEIGLCSQSVLVT